MNSQDIEDKIKKSYRALAARYRKDDERDVTGEDHKRLCQILAMLSASFGRPINVLDMGCGTGRYFHCLRNTRKLVGLDICQEMLDEARTPVRADEISAEEVDLHCGSLFSASYPAGSFDLIYSIGVFGNGCGLTKELLRNCYRWLAPDGRIFFDVIDSSGLPPLLRARKRLRNMLFELCNPPARSLIFRNSDKWPPLYLYSRGEISNLLEAAGFFPVAVYAQECHMPMGQGIKLQCLGTKGLQLERERSDSVNGARIVALSCLDMLMSA